MNDHTNKREQSINFLGGLDRSMQGEILIMSLTFYQFNSNVCFFYRTQNGTRDVARDRNSFPCSTKYRARIFLYSINQPLSKQKRKIESN